MSSNRIVILANGEIKDRQFIRDLIGIGDYLICADGGVVHALNMGLQPGLVVGDMDSLPAGVLEKLPAEGTKLLCFPVEKDKSDLELALERATALAPREILIAGALGGERYDQLFGNLLLLMIPLRAGIPAQIIDEHHRIYLAEAEITVQGRPGDTLSLFPLSASVNNITTEGLKYPLKGETLYFASTRGLSNEFTDVSARITSGKGLLMVVIYST